jgi:ribosomal protein L11 methyltransferase
VIRLAIRCAPDDAEVVLAELVSLAPGGVEEERGDGYVEYGVYGPPGELPSVPELRAAAGGVRIEVSSTEIPDDWADRWRDFHEPVTVGDRLTVRPSWSGGERSGMDVVIDPGQAFGTGGHATTRMCLELLLELADRGDARGSLSDLGTGSGVLAIAAAKLGFAPVVGYDHERPALEAAGANAAANDADVQLLRVNLREELPPLGDTVVANLTGPLLREVAARIGDPSERLVCSGLLVSEAPDVEGAFAAAGLGVTERRADGDWAALLLESERGR